MISKGLLIEFFKDLNIDVSESTKSVINRLGGYYSIKNLIALEVTHKDISKMLYEIKETLDLKDEEYVSFMSLTTMFIDFLYYKNIVKEFIDNTIKKRKILLYFLNSSVGNDDNKICNDAFHRVENEEHVILLLGTIYVFSLYSGDIVLLQEKFTSNKEDLIN